MEAATMKHVQAEEGLVENEVAITVIDEVVNGMEGNEFHQGGEEIEGILYFEGNEKGDIESNDSITEEKPGNEKSDSNITKADNPKSLGTVYDRKRDGNPKNDSLNYMHPLPSGFQSQSSGSLSLKDRRLEVMEVDVERVIEEQDTHDLYCPNCNSCITKRVILRKRKRKIRSIHYDGGSSSDPEPVPEPDPESEPEPVAEEPVIEERVIVPEERLIEEPEIFGCFRCLSCFTFFKYPYVPAACGCEPEGDEPVPPVGDQGKGEPVPPVGDRGKGERVPPIGDQGKGEPVPPGGEKTAENACGREPVGEEPVPPVVERGEGGCIRWFFSCFQQSRGEKTAKNVDQDEHAVEQVVQGRTHEWDILKCIIYGGLIETITSLGVVSSAAAGDATSLNIVVMGLANLMSGLIIIIHNITELKKDCREATSEANSNIARYRETLGREENFQLHAIVTVMSFLVFGLLPPVTYGFSFHRSDDKLYKLITCAAASLVCIILLSIGKAHVQKPPKHYITTILKYLFSGLSASGFCYAVGLLINRFLQNSGWFETTSAPSTVFLETRSMKSGSAFYE